MFQDKVQKGYFSFKKHVGWLFGSGLYKIFNKKFALIFSKPIMLNSYKKFDTKLMA